MPCCNISCSFWRIGCGRTSSVMSEPRLEHCRFLQDNSTSTASLHEFEFNFHSFPVLVRRTTGLSWFLCSQGQWNDGPLPVDAFLSRRTLLSVRLSHGTYLLTRETVFRNIWEIFHLLTLIHSIVKTGTHTCLIRIQDV